MIRSFRKNSNDNWSTFSERGERSGLLASSIYRALVEQGVSREDADRLVRSARSNAPNLVNVPGAEFPKGAFKEDNKMSKASDRFFNFFKSAAIEGAKDGGSAAVMDQIRFIANKHIGKFVPKILKKSKLYHYVEDLMVPSMLYTASILWPNMPKADLIGEVCFRSTKLVFAEHTRVLGARIFAPMFKEIVETVDLSSVKTAAKNVASAIVGGGE